MHMCLFLWLIFFFFFKQKTAYEMRISDWSSDVCSSDLVGDSHRSRVSSPKITGMRLWIRATRSFAWQVITAKVRVQSPEFGFLQFSRIAATPNARRPRRPTTDACRGTWTAGRRHSQTLPAGRTQPRQRRGRRTKGVVGTVMA